jgi:peptide/nickel transport system substrate-binding protein
VLASRVWLRRVAVAVTLSTAAASAVACGSGADETLPLVASGGATTEQADAVARGGTLQVAALGWPGLEEYLSAPGPTGSYVLDPQVVYAGGPWEVFRCCLLRTLMSYSGTSTGEGGAQVRPDLADGPPEVSADGLTWTFHLEPGLHYAPPFQDTEIVAQDVIRALERELMPSPQNGRTAFGSYAVYYSDVIAGAQDFADGKTDSISGLETPDEQTLVVHLLRPTGDLDVRFSMPATAPLPPGAAAGHENGNGRFLVASGPYMVEGSAELDFSRPPDEQEPVSGYVPGESLTLVRNPSWSAEDDDLRGAYPDRIEISLGGEPEEAYRRIEKGTLDLVLDEPPPDRVVRRYLNDPDLKSRVAIFPLDGVDYITLNIAAAPFDDVHVRRAVNLAADKEALRGAQHDEFESRVATHIAPDSLENNLLVDYDPYPTHGHTGDLELARAEMAQSKYDADGDGLCDDPACQSVPLVESDGLDPSVAAIFKRELRELGMTADAERLDFDGTVARLNDRHRAVALTVTGGWQKDFPSATSWFPPLFTGSVVGFLNPSLVGVSRRQLERWGYAARSVPSVDRELAECQATVGGAQFECWAELDQRLMEHVVPWIPYAQRTSARVVSERVASFAIDQAFTMPALDRFALKPDE